MKKKLSIIVICLLLAGVFLAGCGESYKQKGVAPVGENQTIASNGGMAVKVGDYLYYINGYAGQDVDNDFGAVKKGAIARVKLDTNGKPDDSTNEIVVPKNVYSTTKTSGLYVVDGYLYYSSPSTDKNKDGIPQTAKMHLLRTKLDGTGTQVVKKFDDYATEYKVVKGAVLYVKDNELHEINTTTKKFTDTVIDEKVNSFYLTKYSETGENAFIDTVFYLKSSEKATESHNLLYAYRALSGTPKLAIEANATSYAPPFELETDKGYTLSLVESHYIGSDKIRLIYNKTDSGNGQNKKSEGTYAYDFDQTFAFDAQKEVRYTKGSTLTGFTFLADNETAMVLVDSELKLLAKVDGEYRKVESLVPSSPTVFLVDESATGVTLYYLKSNVLCRLDILKKADGAYQKELGTVEELFSQSYHTSWLGLEHVAGQLYFWNSGAKDNTYYVTLANLKARDTDSQKATILGLTTSEDEIALLG